MTSAHEAIVGCRFDALEARFKSEVARRDARLTAMVKSLWPLEGKRVLDLGCGKGRFAKVLSEHGAQLVGLDLSAAMLSAAANLDRVRATARRLPFRSLSFDRVLAVEVFEHLAPESLDQVCAEVRRVLRPGGKFVVLDKNLWSWNAQRPWLPGVLVKWIDERRGRWMYSHRDQAREHWFAPRRLERQLSRWFAEVNVVHVLSRAEARRLPFELLPGTRLFALWAAKVPGGRP
jgi:SAM-dependent methyltransferase